MPSSQVQPKLIIHGGSGPSLKGKGGLVAVRQSLHQVIAKVYPLLLAGASAEAAVVEGCHLLEDAPRFNAGTGSVLQSDGQVRMSASLMKGDSQSFSGTINVSRVKHPIDLAQFLQTSDDRVLSDVGSADLLRELQIPPYNPLTDLRLQEWMQERKDNFSKTMAGTVAESELIETREGETSGIKNPEIETTEAGRGTIGVVALDREGKLAVGTSTGGKGFERVGRVSDSAMPAGNYATAAAAVSCTGIGEDIIDECAAARIVVRVTDGLSLAAAFERTFAEAKQNQRDFGAIGLDATGKIAWGKTCEVLLAAYHDGNQIGDTLEWTGSDLTGAL